MVPLLNRSYNTYSSHGLTEQALYSRSSSGSSNYSQVHATSPTHTYIYIYIYTNLISTSIHGTRKKQKKPWQEQEIKEKKL